MKTTKISQDIFNAKLQNLLNAASSIQLRLLELLEFETQWEAMFSNLVVKYGKDVQIHIGDQMLLQTYRYDKYHIVYDDLQSLIENEIQDQNSSLQHSAFFLQIKPFSDFLEHEKKKEYLGGDIGVSREFLDKHIAEERRNDYVWKYKQLFGESEDIQENWNYLKNNLASLVKELKGLRNLFSHKHQINIQLKYATHWQNLGINKISTDFENFYSLVRELYLLNTRTFIKKGVSANLKVSVSNQIDLMLFGNIENCIHVFNIHFPDMKYSQARNAYYNSHHFGDRFVAR